MFNRKFVRTDDAMKDSEETCNSLQFNAEDFGMRGQQQIGGDHTFSTLRENDHSEKIINPRPLYGVVLRRTKPKAKKSEQENSGIDNELAQKLKRRRKMNGEEIEAYPIELDKMFDKPTGENPISSTVRRPHIPINSRRTTTSDLQIAVVLQDARQKLKQDHHGTQQTEHKPTSGLYSSEKQSKIKNRTQQAEQVFTGENFQEKPQEGGRTHGDRDSDIYRWNSRVPTPGCRKVWRTLKSTTSQAVLNAIESLTNVSTQNLTIKRKFKEKREGQMTKWWFVINADEAILLELETAWSVIEQQTEWTLGPVLRYPESESDPVPTQPTKKMSRKERKRTTYNLQIEKIDQLTKECERLTAEKNAMAGISIKKMEDELRSQSEEVTRLRMEEILRLQNEENYNLEQIEEKRQYSTEVKEFTVKSKTPIQCSDQNQIESGSFGSIYAVNLNGTPCIAKRLHNILMGRDNHPEIIKEYHENFCRECVLMSRAEHTNVVKFLGVHFGKDEFDLTLFMERLHTDLNVYLSSTPDIPSRTKVSILHDVSCGLLYLHEECFIIHRDLTAANILLTADNRAKIADFGISRMLNRSFPRLTKIPGHFIYMPPETFKDNPTYDESLDVFSFGVLTLYVGIQMSPDLSWDPVPNDAKGEQEIFKRKMWIEMMKQKQPELISLVLWCLSDDPKSRPSTYCVNVTLQEMKYDL
ncbi:probable serine/threonine-protein kinase DDB_G0281745 isoform X3 [Halichondria panicea]|uniref:probable serine/threonine-protein kinase DDB_G0281745 isoform X3 n=1 Tax=Halichondria panicea TaxID=6063 RepID=UPI00312B2DFF